MVLAPPVKSSLNAWLTAFLTALLRKAKDTLESVHSILYFLSEIAGAVLLFTVCCLFGLTSAHKFRCGQMVLKELSAFLSMSDSLGHISPHLCVCKVS